MTPARVASAILVVFVAGAAAGCAEQAAPTTAVPALSVTALSITSPRTDLLIGEPVTLVASAVLSDGSQMGLTAPVWQVDNPSVATMTPAGAIVGVAPGAVIVSVSAEGRTVSRRFDVRPDFAGDWTGRYVVAECVSSGFFLAERYCDLKFPIGATLPVLLSLTQKDGLVSGQVSLGNVIGQTPTFSATSDLSASVGAAGALQADTRYAPSTVSIDQQWALTSPQPGRLAGSLVQTWAYSLAAGHMTVRIIDLTAERH